MLGHPNLLGPDPSVTPGSPTPNSVISPLIAPETNRIVPYVSYSRAVCKHSRIYFHFVLTVIILSRLLSIKFSLKLNRESVTGAVKCY